MDSIPAKPCYSGTPTNDKKEYKYFDDNFFIKVQLENNNIIIICYYIMELENKRFEIKVNKVDLINMNKFFKLYDKIEELYELINQTFESKRYKINSYNQDKLLVDLNFEITVNKQNIGFEVTFNCLLNMNGDFSSDYNYILRNEIIRLKKDYDKQIFDLKNQNKEIIKELKYQKQIINELISIKNSNPRRLFSGIQQENLNSPKDIKNSSKELNLKGKNVDIKFLKGLTNYKNLEKLDLSDNNLSDISILGKCRFKYLNVFNISNNKIQDISILKEFQFQKLIELYLNKNKIFNLEPLSKLDLTHLQKIDLSYNYIEDLNSFYRINSPQLKYLNLSHNEIDEITVFGTIQLNQLKELYLNDNKIDLEANRDIINILSNKITIFVYK